MRLLYIGAGFVGACSAAVSADSGHDVLVFDINEERVKMLGSGDREKIEACLFEKGLADLLALNKERINFTANYAEVGKFLDTCDAVFICVPTPEIDETGETDLRYYNEAAQNLAAALAKRNNGGQEKYVVVVNKSTVPIELVSQTEEILTKAGVKNFGVAGNPEFLVEGKAVQNSLKPDRIVVGAWQEKDFAIMRQVYQRFYNSSSVQYIEVNPKEAAAGKLLANFYLLNKLALCYDATGRVCEVFSDLKFENVRRVLLGDQRLGVGDWGFYASLYSGGSCFGKDTRSLTHQLRQAGKNTELLDSAYNANRRQLEFFLQRAKDDANFDWVGKTVAILGLAFKRDTNDARNSPAQYLVEFLKNKAAKIKLYDPAATANFQRLFSAGGNLEYCENEAEAIKKSDAIIIATDWPQFRGLADLLLAQKDRPLIMDGRRMLQHEFENLRQKGYDIIAVGSPFLKSTRV